MAIFIHPTLSVHTKFGYMHERLELRRKKQIMHLSLMPRPQGGHTYADIFENGGFFLDIIHEVHHAWELFY
jgi:hypothetical protein